MSQLDQRLAQLAEQRPPAGAGVLIQRIESRMADAPVRGGSPALHPIRAMTVAAAAVLVFVGGVAVGHWAFGSAGLFDMAFGGGDRRTTAEDISVLAVVIAGASGGTVLLAGSLGLAWGWRRRRRTYRSSIDRGGIMETMERKTQTPDSTERVLRINRWMAVGLVLAIAAVVAVGAWLLVDNLTQTHYEAVVNDFHAAMNSGDGPGAAALFTEDGVFVDPDGREWVGKANITLMVDSLAEVDFQIAITGDTSTFGAFVAVPEKVSQHGPTPAVGSQPVDRIVGEGISVGEFEGRIIKRWVVHANQVINF